MRTVEIRAARTANLRVLVKECGSIAEVARRAGVSEKYLGQVLQGVTQQRGKSPRGLGDGVAEKIEHAFGKPHGWMDTAPDRTCVEPTPTRLRPARDPWPFESIRYRRFENLLPDQKQDLEDLVEHQIAKFEAKNRPPSKTPNAAGSGSKGAHAKTGKSKRAA